MNQHIKPNVGVSQACEQSLHFGKSREFTREPYAKEARGVREEGRAKKSHSFACSLTARFARNNREERCDIRLS